MLEGDSFIECDAGESMNCSNSVVQDGSFKLPNITNIAYTSKAVLPGHGNQEHWYFNNTGHCVKGNEESYKLTLRENV